MPSLSTARRTIFVELANDLSEQLPLPTEAIDRPQNSLLLLVLDQAPVLASKAVRDHSNSFAATLGHMRSYAEGPVGDFDAELTA